jgi:hypothetical protein
MGELQHGIYDDECKGLAANDINAFYGFDENGEMLDSDDDLDDESAEENEVENDEKLELESQAKAVEVDFDTEVCF